MQFCVSFLQVGALTFAIPPGWLLLALLCCTLWEHAFTFPVVGMPLEPVATQLLRWPALRVAFILALLVHEWAHLLASLVVHGGSGAGGPANWRANVPLPHWWQCLLPWRPVPRTMAPHIRGPGSNSNKCVASEGGNRWKDTGVRGAGWVASAALCLASWKLGGARGLAAGPSGTLLQEEMFKASALVLLCCTVTDLCGLLGVAPCTAGVYCCGNFGLLVAGAVEGACAASLDCLRVLRDMAAISTQRGGQSGGLVTLLPSHDGQVRGLRERVCPTKRQHLAALLAARFGRCLWWAGLWQWVRRVVCWWAPAGGRPRAAAPGVRLFLGHTRFATSSIPSVQESHPHQWTPTRRCSMWRQGRGLRSEAVGIYITHNGDFEFWSLFGRDRTHTEMGFWLQRVLDSPQPAHCDSIMIGGLVELLRTQGLWMHSLRLAYHQTVTHSFEEVFDYGLPSDPATANAAPTRQTLDVLARVAEAAFLRFLETEAPPPQSHQNGRGHGMKERPSAASPHMLAWTEEAMEKLTQVLRGALLAEAPALLRQHAPAAFQTLIEDLQVGRGAAFLELLARQAVVNFVHNDLHWAVKKFLANAKGSFGLAVCCTLDPDRVVLAALNQPLSVGLAPAQQAVLYSSEAQSLKTALSAPEAVGPIETVAWRVDLNEADGEVLEIRVTPTGAEPAVPAAQTSQPSATADSAGGSTGGSSPKGLMADLEAGGGGDPLIQPLSDADFVTLRLYNRRQDRAVAQAEFVATQRLVQMAGNPYITFDDPVTAHDLVGHDIQAIPRVLATIRREWSTAGSLNQQTAGALLGMLQEKAAAMGDAPHDGSTRKEIDVLVTAVESSLWVGEQFAADLQNFLPQLRVVPISSNKVIGVLGNARGKISTAGFSFCRLTSSLRSTIVIAISQSGQTFPTLHATRILHKECPGRVFVVSGLLDGKMSQAVGQRLEADAPFCQRVLWTGAGWRAAEPASVSCVAAHATLTELLLYLGEQLRLPAKQSRGRGPLGLRLTLNDIKDMGRVRDALVETTAGKLTGSPGQSGGAPSAVHAALVAQGRRWGQHIVETPVAWLLSSVYIFATVISGWPLFTAIRRGIAAGGPGGTVLLYLAHTLDALSYCFLPLVFSLLLRLLQGRPLLARLGKRTLVIADIPYVHQLLEVYVSKLFALSYSIASLEVHGSNPLDHLVHRFTHRVVRGVLLAVGRPDGRLCTQTKSESWVLMALLQCKSIINGGAGAESFTVGHNPYCNRMVMDAAVVLPSLRPHFLCEKLIGVDAHEPLARLASISHVVRGAGAKEGGNKFHGLDGRTVGEHLMQEGSVKRARRLTLSMLAHGSHEIDSGEAGDPGNREAILAAMEVDVQRLLASQSPMEELTENRFLSLERYIAFLVTFHAMARTVASLWPLSFDISRSQSCLRIATTAAPVSAADLEREWLESAADPEEGTIHVRTLRKRPSVEQFMDRHTLPPTRSAAPLFSSVLSGLRWSPSFSSHSPLPEGGSQRGPGKSSHQPRKTSLDLKDGTWDYSRRGPPLAGAALPASLQEPGTTPAGGLFLPRLTVSPGSSLRGGMLGLPSPAAHTGGSLRGGNAVAGLGLWPGGSRRGSASGLSVLDVLREGAHETAQGKDQPQTLPQWGPPAGPKEPQGQPMGASEGVDMLHLVSDQNGGLDGEGVAMLDDGERGPGRRRKGKPVLDT